MQAGKNSRELLAVALEKVRGQINAVKSARQRISEQDTKGSMIEPILASLGWDTSDLEEVRREYKHNPKNLPVDYAFLSQGKPIMFVEAKAIRHGIDDHKWMAQIVNYANSAGVEICVLTNGDEYRVFNTHAKVPLPEKQIARISLVDDDPQNAFVLLEGLSRVGLLEQRIMLQWQREQLESNVRGALEAAVKRSDKQLVALLAASLKGKVTAQAISDVLKGADLQISFAPDTPIAKTMKAKPTKTAKANPAKTEARQTPTSYGIGLEGLISAGVLKPPLELVTIFKKQELTAKLQQDGSVIYNGESYNSLSLAAGYARNTVSGPPKDDRKFYQTNGWTFWGLKDTGTGKLIPLSQIRDEFLKGSRESAAKSRLKLLK
jgi:predicted type IV restriction endonuclease